MMTRMLYEETRKVLRLQRKLRHFKKAYYELSEAKLEMSLMLREAQRERAEEIRVINKEKLSLQWIIDKMEEDGNLGIQEAKKLAQERASEKTRELERGEDA